MVYLGRAAMCSTKRCIRDRLEAVPTVAAYTDMSGHWAEPAAARWEASQLIDTWKEDTLNPGKAVTSAELEQMLYELDRKSTRLNSSHITRSRMPSSA